MNMSADLVVEAIAPHEFGGIAILLGRGRANAFSGGYKIVLFPTGARGEDWRLLQPSNLDSHFVVCGGKVEEIPEGL